MKRRQIPQFAPVALLIVVLLLVAAQFAFQQAFAGGGWCMPSFDAPTEMGHPSYEFTSYGFPIEFVTVARENCFSMQSTTLEWYPPGILVDGLLLGIVIYIWYRQNRRYKKQVEEK